MPAKGKMVQKRQTKVGKVARVPRSQKEAKALMTAAVMTSQEWKDFQGKVADKWPKPEYMAQPNTNQHGAGAYRDETYEIVTRWSAETKIQYRPHAKAPGSKSHVRYEKYAVAKTVAESLRLGSYPMDWCYDYEHGFIKVLGPVREEAIDMSKVDEECKLSDVDRTVANWYRRELAKNLGLNHQDLIVSKGGTENTLMRAHRLVAQREAKKRLERASKERRRITDEEVRQTLSEWGFGKNIYRQNVMKKGQTWVWSDTMGLLRDRIGDIHVTTSTCMYPDVPRLIVRWLTDRLPKEAAKFGFTSLNLNMDYAAQLHRDGNNFGPSMIAAFGKFEGGELNYWPEDDHTEKLSNFKPKDSIRMDISSGIAMFNGNSGHSVQEFTGNRFSVVYFTLGCYEQAPPEAREKLEKLGFLVPSHGADKHATIRAPRGFGAGAAPKGSRPSHYLWSRKTLEAQRFVPPPAAAEVEPEDAKKCSRSYLNRHGGKAGKEKKDKAVIKRALKKSGKM